MDLEPVELVLGYQFTIDTRYGVAMVTFRTQSIGPGPDTPPRTLQPLSIPLAGLRKLSEFLPTLIAQMESLGIRDGHVGQQDEPRKQ